MTLYSEESLFTALKEAQRVVQHTANTFQNITLDEQFIQALHLLLDAKGNIFFTGVGKSGIIAEKLAATYASLGLPAFFIHPTEALHGDLGRIHNQDLIIALSNSGKTQELLSFLHASKERNTPLIAITNSVTNPLAVIAQAVLNTGIVVEACPWNAVPTTSLHVAMLLGDALVLAYVYIQQLTEKSFFRNHPGGALGSLLQYTAQEIMHTNLPKVTHNTPFLEALHILETYSYGIIFVVDHQNTLLGVITDGDIRRLLLHNPAGLQKTVGEIMKKNPITAPPTASTAELLDILEKNTITTLPIVDTQHILCGIVHIHDILGRGTIQFTTT